MKVSDFVSLHVADVADAIRAGWPLRTWPPTVAHLAGLAARAVVGTPIRAAVWAALAVAIAVVVLVAHAAS